MSTDNDDFFVTNHGEPLARMPADDGQYSDVISANLAEYARLAYADHHTIATVLQSRGINKLSIFSADSAFAYLAECPARNGRKAFSVLAFRGTENDYVDIITDLSFIKRHIEDSPYRVHGGFLSALNQIWGTATDLQSSDALSVKFYGAPGLINALFNTAFDADLYITGHSMGGALAELAAHKLQLELNRLKQHGMHVAGITAVYTIGGPRCQDKALAKLVDEQADYQHYRVVNGTDLVPRMPLFFMGFRHSGKTITLKHNGERAIEMSTAKKLLHLWPKQILFFWLMFALAQWGAELAEKLPIYSQWFGDFGNISGEPWIANLLAGLAWTVGFVWAYVFLPKLLTKVLSKLPGDLGKGWGNHVIGDHASRNYRDKLFGLVKGS